MSSRRPFRHARPIPLTRLVARTEGYTNVATVWALCLVQEPFSVAPCQTLHTSDSPTVRKLFANCSQTVRKLFANCSQTLVRFTHCTQTVRKLFANCSQTVRKLFANCSQTVRKHSSDSPTVSSRCKGER
jgi:hypothetical protein